MTQPRTGHASIPSLRLLGIASLPSASTGIDIQLQYRKGWALLGYLAVERGRSHSREQLAGMLWPNLDGAAARTNLRQVLNALQRAFAELALSHLLRAEKNAIGLVPADPSARVFDIDLLDPLIVEEGDLVDVLVQGPGWQHRGVFLEGITVTDGSDFEDWLAFTRQHYQRRELRLMSRLRERLREDGRHREAIDLGWRIVKADSWNELHHRALMVLLAEEGSRHEATRVYADLERTLRKHLDCAPSAETRDLHERLTGVSTT